MKNIDINSIPAEKFKFVQDTDRLHDQKFDTKPVSYMKDAWRRFAKNKSSVVAMVIIAIMFLYAIVVPWISPFDVSDRDGRYRGTLPKLKIFEGTGFWDGTEKVELSQAEFDYANAIVTETGKQVITVEKRLVSYDADLNPSYKYLVRRDTYYKYGVILMNLNNDEYQAIQAYQNETGRQLLYPMITTTDSFITSDGNYWFKTNKIGAAIYDENGNYQSKYLAYDGNDQYTSSRIEGETPLYKYAVRKQGNTWQCRIDYYELFIYQNGVEPVFAFGTNLQGQDIFLCLASGARFSFLLAIFISIINLTIGAIYGAIEGYYGGATDMIMERISDILSGIPFMITVTLFKLHLADKVGPVVSLLFAFVLTGWIGMAGRVRMQFYRFKNQEYVLAARTLGAKDWRVMWKHVFPNSLGTIITGAVLVIPGVIFSESSLSYLGIINLETGGYTSVGTLLANSQAALSTNPHVVFFPSLFIALLMITFNLFGNGLRDAFNPSLRGSEG